MRLVTATCVAGLLAACGGETDNGGNGQGGSDCSGGSFDLSWTGGESGQASGDCVVTVLSDGTSDGVVPPEVNVSVIEEGMSENVGFTLRVNRTTETPIQAILSLREDVGCNEADVLMMGNFDGTVEFTRRDADGFAIDLDINFSCFDDSESTPMPGFELRVVGSIEGSRDVR